MSIPSTTQNPAIIPFDAWRTITEPQLIENVGPHVADKMPEFYDMWVRQVSKIGSLAPGYIEKYCTAETYPEFNNLSDAEQMQMGVDFINSMTVPREEKLTVIRSIIEDVVATSGEELPMDMETLMTMCEMFIK